MNSRYIITRLVLTILTLLSFLIWILSLFQARNAFDNSIGALGLFSNLPITFFIAFSMLSLSFFLTLKFVKNPVLLIFQTLLLIFFINLTPALIEGTARFTTGYRNFQAVDFILQTGNIDSYLQWVHNWPNFSIFISIFVQITALPAESLLLVYPTFFNILLIPILFIFFQTISDNKQIVWFGLWFVYVCNWVGQDYFSMQSLAFFFGILIIFLLFKKFNEGLSSRQWVISFLLLLFYVITSHQLTSLAILCVLIVYFFSKQFKRPLLLLSSIALITGWAIFNAINYLSGNLAKILKQTLDLSTLFETNLVSRVSGSDSHMVVAQVCVVFTAIILSFSLIGFILLLKDKKIGVVEKRLLLLLIGFSMLLFAFSYGGELFMRLYMFCIVPFAYFVGKAIFRYKYFLLVCSLFFVLVAPPLLMIAHYGNEAIDYVPTSETMGVHHLYSTTNNGHVIGGTVRGGDFRDLIYRGNYKITSFYQLMVENSSSTLWIEPKELYNDLYICLSYQSESYFSFFINNPHFIQDIEGNITHNVHYNLLYSNPSFCIFSSQKYSID